MPRLKLFIKRTVLRAKKCYHSDMQGKKIIFRASIIFLVLLLLFLFLDNISRFAPDKPPHDLFLETNFVDMKKIDSISKYRSCQGHVHVPRHSSESRRNMKHYFFVKNEFISPKEQVEIIAPYDGKVLFMPTGEIYLFPKSAGVFVFPLSQWFLDFDHVKPVDGVKNGQSVRRGQIIANVDFSRGNNAFDVLVAVMGIPRKIDNWVSPVEKLDSVFNYMSDKVFEEYKIGGAQKRENYIITKEYRDANLCVYENGGPYFLREQGSDDTIYFTQERR